VLEAWYGGEEQGNAAASVLFGAVNPSGRLPVTFPRTEEEVPTNTPEQYPGVNKVVTYSEGINVGYRWYDSQKVEPLFPFGFGLSYTTFDFSGMMLSRGDPVPDGESSIVVSFDVMNTGTRAGAAVAQVYVGRLPGTVESPPKQLAGFDKVVLEPGASAKVQVEIDPRSFSYWDTATHAWVVPPGYIPVYVGSSSRDIRMVRLAFIGSNVRGRNRFIE
jgi:beta-glucosidase